VDRQRGNGGHLGGQRAQNIDVGLRQVDGFRNGRRRVMAGIVKHEIISEQEELNHGKRGTARKKQWQKVLPQSSLYYYPTTSCFLAQEFTASPRASQPGMVSVALSALCTGGGVRVPGPHGPG